MFRRYAWMAVALGILNGLTITALVPVVTHLLEGDLRAELDAKVFARDQGGVSTLPMGSLFEGAMFLVFEIMILRLAAILGQSPEAMRARHTNME